MTLVGLLTLLLVVALIGFCVWLVITYVPMPPPFKTAIIVITVILIILYIIQLISGNAPLRIGSVL